MKFSISLITTVFASLAVAAPQLVSSYDDVNSKENGCIVARDNCDSVTAGTAQGNDEPTEELDMQYFETHRKAWNEMASLASEFKEICDWNCLDLQGFEENQEKWSSKLNEIIHTYMGQLPGSYNSDDAIDNLRSQFEAIKIAYGADKAMKEDGRSGSTEVSDLYEMTARIKSLYSLEGELLANVSDLKDRIPFLERDLQFHNNAVATFREMPQKLKNYYSAQAKIVSAQLNELKSKTQEKEKAPAAE